jgi:hypothetical protein
MLSRFPDDRHLGRFILSIAPQRIFVYDPPATIIQSQPPNDSENPIDSTLLCVERRGVDALDVPAIHKRRSNASRRDTIGWPVWGRIWAKLQQDGVTAGRENRRE